MQLDLIFSLLAGFATAAIASFLGALAQKLLRHDGSQRDTIERKVTALTASLGDAVKLISQIENEIKARSELAGKLREDVDRFNQLKQISGAEVEAVVQVLRGELRLERRKSFWQAVGVNFIFFMLGAGTSLLISRLGNQ
jgi:hypothetical protein